MQIQSYKRAADIEEKYLPQLAKRQAECWWAKPFEEYLICVNKKCRAIFSSQEVLWDVMRVRHTPTQQINFCCTECWDTTQEIYNPHKFIKIMKEYFLWAVSSILVTDESDQVEWFGFVTKTTIRSLMEREFNTRPHSYDIEGAIKALWKKLYSSENSEHKNVICFNQIYLSPVVRSSKLSYEVFQKLFEINKDEYANIPLVWDTRYDNDFYPIIRSIWAEDILEDKYGYALQSLTRYWNVLDFLEKHNWFSDFIGSMIKYKKQAREILKNNPNFTQRKFYI